MVILSILMKLLLAQNYAQKPVHIVFEIQAKEL